MVHEHICARSIDHASALRHHDSCFLSQISRSTGFSPSFPLVFSVVQAERVVLYIRRCFPFKLNLPDQSQFHKTPTACPLHLQAQIFSPAETTISGTTAFSDSARLDFERFLRGPDQKNHERLTNSRIALIKVY